MKKRIDSIDIFRGFSIALVINSHLFFGLNGNALSLAASFDSPIFLSFVFFGSIGQLFFFVSGTSSVISINKGIQSGASKHELLLKSLRRGVFIIFIGVLFDPVIYFHFGHVDTLQSVGLASIIVPIVYLQSPPRERARSMLMWGLLVVLLSPVMRLLVGYPVIDPNAEPLVYYMAPETLLEYIQAWLTTSFFPVFPYLSFFFFGAWFGCLIKDGLEKNKLKRIFRIGIFLFIAGLVLVVLPYLSFEAELEAPQWEQEWWIVELSFNVQPMTLSAIMIYTGFIMASCSALYALFDLSHSKRTVMKLDKLFKKLQKTKIVMPILNTFVRYSYLSFTIYVLQYLWIPALRILEAFTSLKLLYSINDEIVLVLICCLANLLFAIYARWMMAAPRRMKRTVEHLVKLFSNSKIRARSKEIEKLNAKINSLEVSNQKLQEELAHSWGEIEGDERVKKRYMWPN